MLWLTIKTDLVLKLILLRAPMLLLLASVNSLLWSNITLQIRYNLKFYIYNQSFIIQIKFENLIKLLPSLILQD